MRSTWILFVGLLLSVAASPRTVGQDDLGHGLRALAGDASTATRRQYLIEVIEFQIAASDGADLSAEQLVESYPQMKSDGLLKRAETTRFYASEKKPSFVNFGKQIELTSASTLAEQGRPVARQVKQIEIGTTAEVLLDSVGEGQVALQVVYRSSRVEGEGTDDSPPDIQSINMEASLVLELGKTKLLGGTSANPNVYVLITISE